MIGRVTQGVAAPQKFWPNLEMVWSSRRPNPMVRFSTPERRRCRLDATAEFPSMSAAQEFRLRASADVVVVAGIEARPVVAGTGACVSSTGLYRLRKAIELAGDTRT